MSGLIPQNFINDLIESADIVEIIGSRLELKKAGRNFQGLCPFHNEKTPSFSVSPEKQFFHCFGCKESGTVLTFLMKYENLDFVEAIEALAKHLGREVPRERGKHESAPEQTKELLALEADELSHPPKTSILSACTTAVCPPPATRTTTPRRAQQCGSA